MRSPRHSRAWRQSRSSSGLRSSLSSSPALSSPPRKRGSRAVAARPWPLWVPAFAGTTRAEACHGPERGRSACAALAPVEKLPGPAAGLPFCSTDLSSLRCRRMNSAAFLTVVKRSSCASLINVTPPTVSPTREILASIIPAKPGGGEMTSPDASGWLSLSSGLPVITCLKACATRSMCENSRDIFWNFCRMPLLFFGYA